MRIAIVGAGLVGLVGALRLSQAGHDVTVFEREAIPGGLVASFKPFPAGDPVERFYHHIFRSDKAFIRLIDELGLSRMLHWSAARTVCWYRGLHRLDSLSSLLMFQPLSLASRIRVAFALGLLRVTPTSKPFENIIAAHWLPRIMGKAGFDILFGPLFNAKFGTYSRDVSLAWFWARIRDRSARLGYLDGGFSCLYDALVRLAQRCGTTFHFQTAVSAIVPVGKRFHIQTQQPQKLDGEYDQVLVTLPLRLLASLVPQLPVTYMAQFGSTPLFAARCVILALDRPLTNAYWINVCEPGIPFSVVVEQTNLVGADRYGGHIVYLGNYASSFEQRPIEHLVSEFAPFLTRINPEFDKTWIRGAWQFVAPAAQPVIMPGHGERIPSIRTPVPGLFNAGIEQTYPHDRGQNYAIEVAELAVSQMLEDSQVTSLRAIEKVDLSVEKCDDMLAGR